ncbi:response regulator [Xylophilus rhododendri]|uniref:Virulence sensor protein BvgS n=1 Tax=Xylophilus rhododendri TaxID=2697032 RepID=A0A857J9X2_9BURK|nr:response regulator [Xylophilus rhododendri]QHJ00707.1 response regulator [Xylophilus rhododendri]
MNTPASIDQRTFKRILSRNLALPLAAGLLGALFFVGLIAYLLNAMSWVEHTDRVIGRGHELSALSADMETGLRGYVLNGDERFLDPYEIARSRFPREIENLQQSVSDNPVQVDRLRRIAALQNSWLEYAAQVVTLRRANGEDWRRQVTSGAGKRFTDEIRREMADFLEMEQRLLKERTDSSHDISVATIALYLIFSLVLSGGLAIFGRRELMRLSDTYNRVLSQQGEHAAFLQRQAWLREGQTELSNRLMGQQALPVLGANVLEYLAQRLGSVVGALYVRDDQGLLRRVAGYGFNRELDASHALLQRGESLVGQAAAEHRLIRLDAVPPDYLRVSSGLGEGLPMSGVVVPIEREGEVNGVIELGFLRPLEERDLDLLAGIAGSVGASVEAARFRQRLQDMLAETQQLNEELQVQQEELRTANEELEEQSRVLRESQASLEAQQVELERSNLRLAEQASALDQRNTALNEARGELEEHAEELQRASRYKSEFLANMSHELRTPLNSSLILAKLLADNGHGNLTDEQVKFAESIYGAGNDLLNLINDILDISKVEAGKLDVRPQDMGLARLVESLRGTFDPVASQKGLEFAVELRQGTPATLYTDRQRVEQILKNLLSNAFKFTERGKVTLVIAPRAEGGLAIEVTDTGIGIEASQQESIFEAFRQADGTTSRRYGGTGLGLTISRDLSHLLGGELTVRSAAGEGSTFTLVLPASYQPPLLAPAPSSTASTAATSSSSSSAASASVAAPAPSSGLAASALARSPSPAPMPHRSPVPAPAFADDRNISAAGAVRDARVVLVVEDETKFAHILFDLAHELGYNCLVAHGLEDGFRLATEHAPDAILLDMTLPDGPGLSLLQRLKENPATRHIPVHVISAQDRTETALHMGAIGYAMKPTSRDQLKTIFHKLEEKLTQKVKRVLVVEDDKLQRESIVHLIGDEDVEITAVDEGNKALELLRDQVFDCMVIDLKLPDMTGNELLRRMSGDDIRAFPPVIVYTGRNLTREEEADLMRYSHSIIIKGARSPERLLDEVTLFLHKVEAELSNERQTMLRTARNRDKVFEGRKVLLVDDDVRNIFALTSALEHKGAFVEVGRNGREALERLAEVPDIDLILMDVMMPEMDGLEATRRIRLNPAWQKLPIITITAKAMKDDQDQCLKAGANDYLAKPVDLDRLFSLLRVWMPKMERSAV